MIEIYAKEKTTYAQQVVFDSENSHVYIAAVGHRSNSVGLVAAVSHRFLPFYARFASVSRPFFSRFLPVFYRLFSPSLSEKFLKSRIKTKKLARPNAI